VTEGETPRPAPAPQPTPATRATLPPVTLPRTGNPAAPIGLAGAGLVVAGWLLRRRVS
jgi:LPXTG-motif cell wall-anchored protein